jgi:hypothetical protein
VLQQVVVIIGGLRSFCYCLCEGVLVCHVL